MEHRTDLARLLFGDDHPDALAHADGDGDSLRKAVFAHPLNRDAQVAHYRLSKTLSHEDIENLRPLFLLNDTAVHVGRSLHSALADYAESCLDCAAAVGFLDAFESALPVEGPDGLWGKMAHEGGIIRAMASFRNGQVERMLKVRVEFVRPPSTEHVLNELAEFTINGSGATCRLMTGLPSVYAPRLLATFPFIIPYLERCDLDGAFDVSLGDEAVLGRVLGFSSQLEQFLVPDIMFVASQGYAEARTTYAQAAPWHQRLDRAYWRGTDTGVFRYRNIDDAPRVAVAKLALRHPDILDAKITDVEPRPDRDAKRAYYESECLIGDGEPQSKILDYKYQVDIDGNTNTWSGLFLKLLTGSPVLKVKSELGFKQWYYDLLVPWENYVPVEPDLSDLIEKINWLRDNPTQAHRIGNAGRQLANSIDFHNAMIAGSNAVEKLVQVNKRLK
ncbi:glycosyl transferase family 90 [Sphingobium algorifonticola]|uniref:Glycosyl transferase CAP10 domain-containing protein n=1 Tax=Sphingobium algorifonticola TaxID=2008318 RepID=A0A437J7K6_9SPHN|nr:glycosyl transferase family 90 [Sphingobium algorifonticola]RVT41027.1 hypothetical protein ENE74_11295 [Sphingobium algorifonticola]